MSKPRRIPPETEIRSTPADTYIGIRVPAHLNDQLQAIAKRENNGKSAVCRRLLTSALKTSHDHEAA
jgi:hypothetical protein